MSGYRDLTTEEAIKWALDPRNDNGEPNAIHVMAFSYDSDCPNYEDHIGAVIENPRGWFDGDGFVKEEANAKLYATVEEAQLIVAGLNMAPSYSGSTVIENPCRCWDGISSDDVETFIEDIDKGDTSGFGEWGPFSLEWPGEDDPGEPRDFTPEEALSAISSRLEAFEGSVHNFGMTLRMSRAVDALHRFITQVEEHGSTDLEWGEPGDCWDRLVNDPDVVEALRAEGVEGPIDDTTIEIAKRLGLARHYGDPHCIWCLQAS